MKSIDMNAKVELTALQLVYLLDDAMETLCLRAEDGQEVDTMVVAKEKVLELFGRTRGSEDGKDAGREPYRVGKGIDEQLLYKNNELYAEFKNAKEAERVCNLLNEQHRKEQNND